MVVMLVEHWRRKSMSEADEDWTAGRLIVVVNHEGQYSIWPASKPMPGGWERAGKEGSKSECLEYIGQVWTDMTPKSLRQS